MFLNAYHQRQGDVVTVAKSQASQFAKQVADDFNPLHNEDAKRFCVPGDLLFSLVLANYGLSQNMQFRFVGMVGDQVPLVFTDTDAASLAICDEAGKAYIEIERSGAIEQDTDVIEAFSKQYVAFSGRNFPHILMPLMQQHNVMINPARPMVMYESMAFELQQPLGRDVRLSLSHSELTVDGKRGEADLFFDVFSGDQPVGSGQKHLLLSGLRPYEAQAMDLVCESYNQWKAQFKAS